MTPTPNPPKEKSDKGWPNYLFRGRVRTSTAALVVAFIALFWVYQTFQPEPAPQPAVNQVVPPGFVPDPDYTWVPRTQVEAPVTTTRRTPRTTTTTTTTTTTPTTTSSSGPATTPTTPTPGQPTTTVIDPDGPGPAGPTTLVDPDGPGTLAPQTTAAPPPPLFPGLPPLPGL
jgi:hypothetical protein